ncbi:MAG: type II toxin-antitoxin system HicB family antitoxin [Magnetococcales bacterium]|nr:type II toxin-antitoxin system HicB family antitoxin [Magnetococcales bacterium]
MIDIRYPVILAPQKPSGFFVRFPDLDDTFTEGETIEEALHNASEVLTAMLGWKVDNNMTIPEPSQGIPNARYVAPDAKTQAALLLRQIRREQSIAEVSRSMGTSWSSVHRLEDPHHWPTLRQLEKAAATLGKRLVLSFD